MMHTVHHFIKVLHSVTIQSSYNTNASKSQLKIYNLTHITY